MRDCGGFQRAQAKAALRRRDRRALMYSNAFGPESLFALRLQPVSAIGSVKPDAPNSIIISGFDLLRREGWEDLRSFLPMGLRRIHNTCHVNNVCHVLLSIRAMAAWLQHYNAMGAQEVGC